LLTAPEYLFISSSAIRELAQFKGDVHNMVPECVEIALRDKQKVLE
jgi:pantetheine-phosphate adenylyltransferase